MCSAGFEPVDPYPVVGSPWKSKCTTCNQMTLLLMGPSRMLEVVEFILVKIVIPELAKILMLASNLELFDKYLGGKFQ